VPDWVVISAYLAIAAGTLSGGWRIVRTMGEGITELRPVSGFGAETAAAIAIFGSTALGAPVSTAHTVAGSITGVGTANRGAPVSWKAFGRPAIDRIITMPAAAAATVMSVLLLALVAALAVALRRAPKARDVDPGDRPVPVGLRQGAGSVIDARGVPASREVLEHGGSLDQAEAAVRTDSGSRSW
jgi:inorganic phosphate transporter, PiT family